MGGPTIAVVMLCCLGLSLIVLIGGSVLGRMEYRRRSVRTER